MAALFAAFIHDVGHPGRNNNYLIATGEWVGKRRRERRRRRRKRRKRRKEEWGGLSVFAFCVRTSVHNYPVTVLCRCVYWAIFLRT